MKEVCGSLRNKNVTNVSLNLCLLRVNMLSNCQISSRLVGIEGNVIIVAYGKCKCGLTPSHRRPVSETLDAN